MEAGETDAERWLGTQAHLDGHHMAGDSRCCRTMLRMISGVQRFGTSPFAH